MQKVGLDMSLGFVLAGLAGEDDDEGQTEIGRARSADRIGDLRLVGAEGDADHERENSSMEPVGVGRGRSGGRAWSGP